MKLFRIGPEQHINNLTGRGASYRNGARWNYAGQPVLYFGSSASVAMLEMGNYIPSPKMVPKNYVIGTFEVTSTTIETMELDDMFQGWDRFPYSDNTQLTGAMWLSRGESLVLLVPSCAASGLDKIAVVNPNHPDISTVRLIDTKTQIYNPRLFKGLET